MDVFKGIVGDVYGERDHTYPATDKLSAEVRLKYDFILTRNGKWFYMSSTNDPQQFINYKLNEPVEEKGEQWKIVEAISGEVFKEHLND